MYTELCLGQDHSVMKIMDIDLDPSSPQKGEALTVTMQAILCEFYILSAS